MIDLKKYEYMYVHNRKPFTIHQVNVTHTEGVAPFCTDSCRYSLVTSSMRTCLSIRNWLPNFHDFFFTVVFKFWKNEHPGPYKITKIKPILTIRKLKLK